MMQPITRPRSVRGNREMSIMEALHWAFATEKAQLDFDLTGAHEFDRPGIDPIWRGMQMATLGCASTAVEAGRPETRLRMRISSPPRSRRCPRAAAARGWP